MANLYQEIQGWGWDPKEVKEALTRDVGVKLAETHVDVRKSEVGVKFDADKAPLHLIPVECLEEVAKVLSYGSQKYSDWNWAKGFKWSRLYGATLRHLYAHMRGEDKDKETNISHLTHATCNLLFLMYHELHQVGEDDRHPRPASNRKEV